MDLFARELILPRDHARRWHVEGGLAASEIAKRLAVPFNVVVQQLLDALLPTIKPTPPKPDMPLDASQKRAAEHGSGPFLLGAGPGTGKTKTLAARVKYLLDRKVDPRRILILTFSNKAAAELNERILHAAGEDAAAVWAGTFHAFGLDVVRRYHQELGFDRTPRMIDRTEAIELLEPDFAGLELRHYQELWDPTETLRDLLQAVSRAQDELCDDERYAALSRHMADRDPDQAARSAEVALVYERYRRLKEERRLVDFGDLIFLPVKLMLERPDVRAELSGRFDHVLVDEYQDVNRCSVELLRLLLNDDRNLWAVGDARQSIYRFRGASSFSMARFAAQDFPGAATDDLEVNYRSTAEIVRAFGAFGATMATGSDPKDLEAKRGASGVHPEHRSVLTADEEGAAVAAAITELKDKGLAFKDQVVLCAGNERLARIAADLERRQIPVLYLGSLFERPEIKDLLSWLLTLADPRAMGLARLKAPDALNPSLADVSAILAHLARTKAPALSWTDASAPGLSPEGKIAVEAIVRALDGSVPADQPWPVLARLLFDATRIAADLFTDSSPCALTRGVAIWQFMNFLRVQPAGAGLAITRLLERVRTLVRLSDDRDLRQLPAAAQGIDAVRLMTIHGSKGLEFKAVHLPGVNGDALPRAASPVKCPPPDGMIVGASGSGVDAVKAAHAEEQKCLFYVALSRARDVLILYCAREKSNRSARPPSPFLNDVAGLTRQTLNLAESVLRDPDDAPLPITFEDPLELSLPQVESYEKCPRRFLYTHVLSVGGRRTTTDFMEMHDVVQATIGQLSSGAPVVDESGARACFEPLWATSSIGQSDHGAPYRRIAERLIGAYVASRRGRQSAPVAPGRFPVPGGAVVVTPDEAFAEAGYGAVRRIRTGKRPSRQGRFAEAVFHMTAARGGGSAVELVYLSDGGEPVIDPPTQRVRSNRETDLADLFAAIKAGLFPKKASSFVCPRCPSFHICGPVPDGALKKNLSSANPESPTGAD